MPKVMVHESEFEYICASLLKVANKVSHAKDL